MNQEIRTKVYTETIKKGISPKVSIIIPTYNRAGRLTKAIESALAQDYKNLEVIVSDNASQDETKQAVMKYTGDSRFRYFRNSTNIGMRLNFRKSLYEYATGEWAIFLADDDYFLDNTYIRKAIKLAQKDDDIIMVHANWLIIYENRGWDKQESNLSLPDIVDGRWMFLNYGKKEVGIIITSTVFKRDVAISCNLISNDVFSGDIEFYLTLFLEGKVGFLKDVVVSRLIHRGGIGQSIDWQTHFDDVIIYTSILKRAKELQCFDEKSLQRWEKRNIKRHLRSVLRRILDNGDRGDLKQCIAKIMRCYPFALWFFFNIRFLFRYFLMGRPDVIDRVTLLYRMVFQNIFR